MASSVRLLPAMLPFGETVVFRDSSFFKQANAPSALPSPAEVRRMKHTNDHPPATPPPSRFPSLNLLVKYGREITIAEGQCLWAIRHLLHDAVRVPEVYGWYRDGDEVFIYMQLIPGVTLEARWPTLSTDAKTEICQELHAMITALRTLEQDPTDPFIGHVGRQPLCDVIFSYSRTAGPFSNVSSFHDYFAHLSRPSSRAPDEPAHPYCSNLPSDVPIKFTHGDLHRSNILVSADDDGSPPRVLAIIDWHQSGWLPAYWEYCKARWTAEIGEDWEVKYIPTFLEPSETYYWFDYFVLSLGM